MARTGKRFLRVRDVADALGLSTTRTYALIATGQIPATRIGGRIAIPAEAWQSWLHGRTTDALASLRDVSR